MDGCRMVTAVSQVVNSESRDGDYCMSLQSKTAKESEPQIKQTIKPPLKFLHFTKGDYTMSWRPNSCDHKLQKSPPIYNLGWSSDHPTSIRHLQVEVLPPQFKPQIKQTIKIPLKCLHFTKGDYTMSWRPTSHDHKSQTTLRIYNIRCNSDHPSSIYLQQVEVLPPQSKPQIKQTIKPHLKCLHFTKCDYTMTNQSLS